MGDIRFSPSASSANNSNLLVVDPSALVEAILGHKVRDQTSPGSDSLQSDYDELGDVKPASTLSGGRDLRPDSPPKDVRVGVVNPWALAEAILGRKIESHTTDTAKILASVLQTEYYELFDMKHGSMLFAGLKLNRQERKAERLTEKEMKILNEHDLETPDLSEVEQLKDLERLGLKDLGEARVNMARLQNGKLHLVVNAHSLGKMLTNRDVTMTINELVTPFRMQKGHWMPPNGSWRDMYDYYFQMFRKRVIGDLAMFQIGKGNTMHSFDDPVQGCTSNSWLIAALFSVFWSDPSAINRSTRVHQAKDEKKRLVIKFHDKGGPNNARTDTVEVNYEIPMHNSNNEPMYCRCSDGADVWPSLYEKAFAKWITGSSGQQPDITQTHSGDPVKAMAQINGRDAHYYMTDKHPANDLLGLVRSNCVNLKTISPMTAWTYATGNMYTGSNIVANHAYSVLGYTVLGQKQYIILRNPWGVTEPTGLTSYQGLLERIDPNIWCPAAMLDHGGLFGLEADAFKDCFACIGIAK